tara:strand:- start:5 stop:121 length:117 start_codon:yes stop_codon:yes gene_type:complete
MVLVLNPKVSTSNKVRQVFKFGFKIKKIKQNKKLWLSA